MPPRSQDTGCLVSKPAVRLVKWAPCRTSPAAPRCPAVPSFGLKPSIEKDPLYSTYYKLTTKGMLPISLYIKSHLWEPCIPGNKHQAKIITLFGSQETSCPDSPVNHSREADINTCPLKPDQNEEIFDFPPPPPLRINIKQA